MSEYIARMLPDMRAAKEIAIDVETHDPDLFNSGAGWAVGKGKLIGISVASDVSPPMYIPLESHYGTGFPVEVIRAWARRNLTTSAVKVGANLMYDLGWLMFYDIPVSPPYYDVQWAAALLDEQRQSYSLDSIAKDVLGDEKKKDRYREWVETTYGARATSKNKLYSYLHAAPLEIIAEYAAKDAELPLRIRDKQLLELKAQSLEYVLDLEHSLIPLLLDMKKHGVRIDTDRLSKAQDYVAQSLDSAQRVLRSHAGFDVNVDAASDMKKLFDACGLQHGVTEKGNPSFSSDVLSGIDHPVAKAVLDVKRWQKVEGTFLSGYMGKLHNGHIHADFNPLRRDGAGTVSGRFSSSNPNLQNIPSRDDEVKKLLRGLFVPEEGELWGAADWSQVEYRIMLCFAKGKEAEAARRRFIEDPSTDFHRMVADMCRIDRTPAKTINFGILYGMSVNKLMLQLGISEEEAEAIMDKYHSNAPYVSRLNATTKRLASTHKYITSLSGRRHRFNQWSLFGVAKPFATVDEARAYAREHGVRAMPSPYGLHTALNRRIQGSAADVLKEAMRAAYEAGVFSTCRLLLTVHDEFGVSVPDTNEGREAFKEMCHIMETVGAEKYALEVPLKVDASLGKTWADAK